MFSLNQKFLSFPISRKLDARDGRTDGQTDGRGATLSAASREGHKTGTKNNDQQVLDEGRPRRKEAILCCTL